MDSIFGNVIYQRRQLDTCGQSKTGWKIPVILICCLPPALIYALDAGDPESTVAPSGPPASTVVRCVTRCVEPRLRPGMAGAAWGRPGSSAGPTLMPTSSSSVKLYFSYPEFGLIYIYTNIYINIYIYTVILLN